MIRRVDLGPALALGLVMVAGCSPHELRTDTDPGVPIPDSFASTIEPAIESPTDWWRSFDEPGLDAAIESE